MTESLMMDNNQEKIIACQFDDSVELFLEKQHKSLFIRIKEYIQQLNIWRRLWL